MTAPITQFILWPLNTYFACDTKLPTWVRAINLVAIVFDVVIIQQWMYYGT